MEVSSPWIFLIPRTNSSSTLEKNSIEIFSKFRLGGGSIFLKINFKKTEKQQPFYSHFPGPPRLAEFPPHLSILCNCGDKIHLLHIIFHHFHTSPPWPSQGLFHSTSINCYEESVLGIRKICCSEIISLPKLR